jgi:DNA invertase Pin-like site-specific DNA recombinase
MTGQRIGYVRVSTLDQNPERQLEQVALDRVFTDHASGKDTERPQLEALLSFIREGIALAKRRGVYRGRRKLLSEEQAGRLRERVAAGEPKAAVARAFGISRETLYRYLERS